MLNQAIIRPPRCTITNLATGVGIEVQANPEQLAESVSANYGDETVPGLSHQVSQFSHTSNFSVSIELHYMARSMVSEEQLQHHRRFLFSLAYPTGVADEVGSGGPPRALFVWPGMLALTCSIRSVNITHNRFNRLARSVEFRAQVQLSEIRDVRITSESVYNDDELRLGLR
jgi:hypothetical protein